MAFIKICAIQICFLNICVIKAMDARYFDRYFFPIMHLLSPLHKFSYLDKLELTFLCWFRDFTTEPKNMNFKIACLLLRHGFLVSSAHITIFIASLWSL